MAFAVVKSKTPTGIGQIFKDCEGSNSYKLMQAMTDFGFPCNLTVRNNFGRVLHNWSIIWAKDIMRHQGKEIIRTLLNQLEVTQNFEMFVCSAWQEIEGKSQQMKHVAFDLDDSHQNGKVKVDEAMRRWGIIRRYNYRAPTAIKYDEMLENYEPCDVDYKHLRFFNVKKE